MSICEDCFEGNHEGHTFRVYDVACYCDCGNPSLMKKESCCDKHRNFQSISLPPALKDQLLKEMSYLCGLGVRLVEAQLSIGSARSNLLMVAVGNKLKLLVEGSYPYQLAVSELMLGQLSPPHCDSHPNSVLVHILDTEWDSAVLERLGAVWL